TNISLSFIAKFVSKKLIHPVCDVLHISVAGSFRRKTPVCSQHVPKQTVRVDTAVYVFVAHGQLEGRSQLSRQICFSAAKNIGSEQALVYLPLADGLELRLCYG